MRNKTPKHSPPHNHHSSSPSSSPIPTTLTESILKETIESAEKIIPRWSYYENSNHCMTASLFSADDSREDATEFISAVNNLQSAIRFLASNNASSKVLVRSQELIQIAMKWLGREFSFILNRSPATSDPLSDCEDEVICEVDSHDVMDLQRKPSVQAMNDLKSIADCMMNCGFSKECAKIYRTVRKSVVDEALYRLGIDRLSLNLQHHKLDWEAIENKIKNWLSAMKIAVKSVFSEERILCDLVFLSSTTNRESCFSELAREGAVSVFGFPEQVVSKCKKSPEKLFRILDLYEAILELSPEINDTFSSDSSSAVRLQVETSLEKLREAAQTALAEFESAIQKDTSKTPVTGGGVHPITRYVMNYLAFLSDYTGVLEQILATWQLNLHATLPEEYVVAQRSGDKKAKVAVRFMWLILVLLSKLDGKSEIYKEVSLSYLFLANNLQYVVKKVQTSELRRIVGDRWTAGHGEKVRQYAASYERTGWRKVNDALIDDSHHRTAEDSLERDKERLRKFNGAFLEVQKKHMEWVVVDPELREEIKDSLARNVVSKYREIYVRYREKLASRRNVSAESVVKYAPEDLENYLWGLLFGCSDGDSRSSKSRPSTTSFLYSTSSPSTSTSSPLRARCHR